MSAASSVTDSTWSLRYLLKMMYILAWFIYILCVFGALGVLRESNLQKDSLIVDVLCPVADINFGTTRSVLFCAEHCSSNSVCTSVFYHKTTKECYGATTTIYSASGCESRLGMMYFKQGIVQNLNKFCY